MILSPGIIRKLSAVGKLVFVVETSLGKVIAFNMKDVVKLMKGEYIVDIYTPKQFEVKQGKIKVNT